MFNPFKKSYKISETTENNKTYYWAQYGWFWGYEYLCKDGSTCDFWGAAKIYGKFESVDSVEAAIKKHAANLIEKRLNKSTTKTVKYV